MSKFTKRKRRFSHKNGKNIIHRCKKALCGLSLVLVLGAVICLYLSQVNSSTPKLYEMHDLEDQISILKDKNEKLKIGAAELKSLVTLEERIEQLNLVKAGEVSYLAEKDAVAVAR